MWSLDQQQQHQHPVGTCYKCRFLDPTRDFDTLRVGPNLWTSPPGDFDACCILRITAIGQWLNPIKDVEIQVKLITDLWFCYQNTFVFFSNFIWILGTLIITTIYFQDFLSWLIGQLELSLLFMGSTLINLIWIKFTRIVFNIFKVSLIFMRLWVWEPYLSPFYREENQTKWLAQSPST